MSLREELQQSLGSAYTIERELGGGGMSRVFLAREEALKRNVVIKLLPPDLLAGVSLSRFTREIQLAAGLQHPHIVPVHSAGEMDGVPFYTMPFVEGDSLRARLASGALPMTEAVGILRDVAKALAYAHERGIVHRDIKPDNILLSGGSATVTDFGIAKALDAAKDAQPTSETGQLTSVGMSIGTPAYMAPEQAAADSLTNHRADIYSFGCVAYEMLTGRQPFTATTMQRLLVAQMTETAAPVTTLRPDTPVALADLVTRCMAKDADDRPQSASELVHALESATLSGSSFSALPATLLGGRSMLAKALGLYATAFVTVALIAKAAIIAIGLPDWVFPGALIMMALGLPVILFTALVHYTTRRAVAATPTYTPGGSVAHGTMAAMAMKASPHVSWRRTAVGGAWAIGLFVVLVGLYMITRAMGIGPAASLLASGAIGKNERLLVDDFQSPAGDTTLGAVVSEAFRTSLAQSQSVTVIQQAEMRDVLKRMLKPADARVDLGMAREMAARAGARLIVDGSLIGIGGKYTVSARLVAPQTGEVLAQFSENAASQADILAAIDKLSRAVRAKIGDSFKRVQNAPPLEQVTTASFDALKKYVAATNIMSREGNTTRAAQAFRDAIAADTSFAMAWRRLAVVTTTLGLARESQDANEHAFAHRERLTDVERYTVIGSYYQFGAHQDAHKAIEAYEHAMELDSGSAAPFNNIGVLYRTMGQPEKAVAAQTHGVSLPGSPVVSYGNLFVSLLDLGRIEQARKVHDDGLKAYPNSSRLLIDIPRLYMAQRQFDSAATHASAVITRFPNDTSTIITVNNLLSNVAHATGRISDALALKHERYSLEAARGVKTAPLAQGVDKALAIIWFLGDTPSALKVLEDSLSRHPLDTVTVATGTIGDIITVYTLAHRLDKAKALVARWESMRTRTSGAFDANARAEWAGKIALASGNSSEAIRQFRLASVGYCRTCEDHLLGQAYDQAGNPDSTIAAFERYTGPGYSGRDYIDGFYLAGIHKRLGELYEQKGNRADALKHYNEFVALWKNADPVLQPRVVEVRGRIARLSKVEGQR